MRIGISKWIRCLSTDDPLSMMVFSDKLFSDEYIADMPVSDNEELPMSTLQVFTDDGVPLVPPGYRSDCSDR